MDLIMYLQGYRKNIQKVQQNLFIRFQFQNEFQDGSLLPHLRNSNNGGVGIQKSPFGELHPHFPSITYK